MRSDFYFKQKYTHKRITHIFFRANANARTKIEAYLEFLMLL